MDPRRNRRERAEYRIERIAELQAILREICADETTPENVDSLAGILWSVVWRQAEFIGVLSTWIRLEQGMYNDLDFRIEKLEGGK